MPLKRALAVIFLALGFAFGSVAGVAMATEQAFAKPCPMEHQSDDCPCCKDNCTGPMMGCAAKCAPSVGMAALPSVAAVLPIISVKLAGLHTDLYDPFVTGPPPKIPIG